MNVYKFRNVCNCRQFLFKTFLQRSVHTARKTETGTEIETLTKQDAKITEGSAGILIASCENYSPVSRVSVVIKAGSRYESPHNLGITHRLRNCAALSTKNHSAFSLTRNLELKGSKLSIASTREHIIYSLQSVRDEIDSDLEILADIATNQAFKPWEINDSTYKMELDLALLDINPEAVLMEALHKAAFRGGLANSLYCPTYMIGKHNTEMLLSYVDGNFSVSRTAIIGLGVNHDNLQTAVDKLFNLKNPAVGDEISKFLGSEVRIEKDIPFVHSAIIAEGASLKSVKEALSLGLLQCILSNGDGQPNKFCGSKFSKLGEAASKSTNNPFHVSCLNVNYSDTGFFGVYVCGTPDDMKELVKSVVTQMRDVTKNITESDLQTAKHQLKAKLRLTREHSDNVISAMAIDAINFKQFRDIRDIEKTIDDLKTTDVATIASKVMKTKPAMAAVGRLHATPHLDELI